MSDWTKPPEYAAAIDLAFNSAAKKGLEISDYLYHEDNDMWYVEVEENGWHNYAFMLRGNFVRSCYKAVQEGVISWIEAKAV